MSETGFPELPEGYFWRVRHRRTFMEGYYRPTVVDQKGLQVQLIQKHTETRAVAEKKWFRTVTSTEEISYETDLFTEDAKGTNPIAIRNAANRIMNQWEKAKERDSLVGDYPPKKLEVA